MVTVYIPSRDDKPINQPASPKYTRWLARYAVHVAVTLAAGRHDRRVSLSEVRDTMLDMGLLDGFRRDGDGFVTAVYRTGPFDKPAGDIGRYELQRGTEVENYADPGPPPPIHEPVKPASVSPPARK